MKRKQGEQLGFATANKPENTTEYCLSRMQDMLDLAVLLNIKKNLIFKLFPSGWKLDFNYSTWTYQERIDSEERLYEE